MNAGIQSDSDLLDNWVVDTQRQKWIYVRSLQRIVVENDVLLILRTIKVLGCVEDIFLRHNLNVTVSILNNSLGWKILVWRFICRSHEFAVKLLKMMLELGLIVESRFDRLWEFQDHVIMWDVHAVVDVLWESDELDSFGCWLLVVATGDHFFLDHRKQN